MSAPTGYLLRPAAGQLDLIIYQDLACQARAAQKGGDLAASCDLYDEALALWRQEPLADIALLRDHPSVTGLIRQHAALVLDYANAATEAGMPERVLQRLHQLAASEPLDERVHGQLMIALAGCGRQATALQVFEDLRRRLDEELGLAPSAALADAQRRVLWQELRLAPSS